MLARRALLLAVSIGLSVQLSVQAPDAAGDPLRSGDEPPPPPGAQEPDADRSLPASSSESGVALQDEPEADARERDARERPADRAARRSGGRSARGAGASSWVSLGGHWGRLPGGRQDVGGVVLVGLALDRMAGGPSRSIRDPPQPAPAAPALALLPPSLARQCVAAALRTAGVGSDDRRLDEIAARSRVSALLPETRLRGMRLWTDAAHSTLLPATDSASYYAAIGANLVLEARLTWRLDRLVYAADETALERIRLVRQDLRSRLAARTLQALFAWQRARLDGAEALAGSREQIEAALRATEQTVTLDVLTGGWFSANAQTP